MSSIRASLKIIAFSLIPLLLMALSAEIGARVYKKSRPSYWQFIDRLTNPAYTSKPWFSEDFLSVTFGQRIIWFSLPGTRLVFPEDFRNKYQTVEGGLRKTTDNSFAKPYAKMMILGGSTTFCSEVPDNLTWPSQLQRLLNEQNLSQKISVLNCGVTSVNSVQELERLKYEIASNNKPDICIFFNGVNDVNQGVMYKNPEGVLFETAKGREARIVPKLRKASAFIDIVVEFVHPLVFQPVPISPGSSSELWELAERTAKIYEANMRQAQAICDQHGILLFIFLQPNLYTINRPLNHHEKAVSDRLPKVNKVCFDTTYPLLKRGIDTLKKDGINAFDVSNIFDSNEQPIFIDAFHVEDQGNAIIARSVLEHIFSVEGISLPRRSSRQ